MEFSSTREYRTPDSEEPTIKEPEGKSALQVSSARESASRAHPSRIKTLEVGRRERDSRIVIPIYCQLESDASSPLVIPAIKVTEGTTHWEIYPLSKQELGVVWKDSMSMNPWTVREDEVTWEDAAVEFCEVAEYNLKIMRSIMRVLRDGEYFDGAKVTKSNWNMNCKYFHEKVKAAFSCCKCNEKHDVASRYLHDVPCDTETFECKHLGQDCDGCYISAKYQSEVTPSPALLTALEPKPPKDPEIDVEKPKQVSRTVLREGEKYRLSELWEDSSDHDEMQKVLSLHPLDTNPYETFHTHHPIRSSANTHSPFSPINLLSPYETAGDTPPVNPSQFILGRPASQLRAPDPSSEELQEFAMIRKSPLWIKYTTTLMKWKVSCKDCKFSRGDNVASFHSWHHAMKTFFETLSIDNAVIQGMIATLTFTRNAREWWQAHVEANPKRVVTFIQLNELIKTELVPKALPTASHRAWWKLEYKRNVEQYLQHVTDLMRQYPLAPRIANSLATLPISERLSEQIEAMDDTIGGNGMTLPMLKRQIRLYLAEKESQMGNKRWQPPKRFEWEKYNRVHAASIVPPSPGLEHHLSRPPKPSVANESRLPASAFCLICGATNHIWPSCRRKQRTGCAAYGSTTHIVRNCAQRFLVPNMKGGGNHQTNSTRPNQEGTRDNSQWRTPPVHNLPAGFATFPNNIVILPPCSPVTVNNPVILPTPESPHPKAPAPVVEPPPLIENQPTTNEQNIQEKITPVNRVVLVTENNHTEEKRRSPLAHEQTSKCLLLKNGKEKEFTTPLPSPWARAIQVRAVEETCISQDCGVALLKDPSQVGQLLYPISVDGRLAVALLDLGASVSFVDKQWMVSMGLHPSMLTMPRRLSEFSSPGTWVTEFLPVHELVFAHQTLSWELIVTPRRPANVVIGLDIVRAWGICFNPLDDRVYAVRRDNPGVLTMPMITDSSSNDINMECNDDVALEPRTAANALGMSDDSSNPDGLFEPQLVTILTHDYHPTDTHPHCIVSLEIICDLDSHSALSVTRATEEDEKSNKEIITQLPPLIRQLTTQFPELFSPPDAIPPPRDVVHDILLKPHVVPVKRAAYPLGVTKLEAMRIQIQELFKRDWIEPSHSPWASPILFVKKKEGEWRLVIDFRDLNALTVDNSYPLPRVETLLHRAGGASIFSQIDLASGFHQIALTPFARPCTAFRLPEPVEGCTLWQWRVMPFGLRNAPPTFQRAMTKTLQGCEDFAVVYVDDILVFSSSLENYVQHLRSVFTRLQADGFHLRLSKCMFAKPEVEFLGHTLSSNGLTASPHKLQILNAWVPPFKTSKQVRQFMGLIMWYKSFIPHLATIAAPLFPLSSTKRNFQWSDPATQAVDALKSAVNNAPCLAHWEHHRLTRVITDASKVGIGAVIE